MQLATAYQFRIFESAKIETVALDCQDTLNTEVNLNQAPQHAENLHGAGFHIPASSVEAYLQLKTIWKTIRFYIENHTSSIVLLQVKMKDCNLELEPWKQFASLFEVITY